jgi:hypothetical protein
MVIISPSMPTISATFITRRLPSESRERWITMSMAEATWRRIADSPIAARPSGSSSRDGQGIPGRVRVERGERAVVAGVHGLEHVQGLGPTHLTHDDPVGRIRSALITSWR